MQFLYTTVNGLTASAESRLTLTSMAESCSKNITSKKAQQETLQISISTVRFGIILAVHFFSPAFYYKVNGLSLRIT
jgi:hypothetical protein